MKTESIVYTKAFEFAIQIIELYKQLINEKKEYVMSKQLLKSGTSIGANIKEALAAQSKRDFIAKLHISLKETSETEYWIELLIKTDYITKDKGQSLLSKLRQIYKMLSSIIMTAKKNMHNNS